jgi:glycine betaine/proline transport system substrate-binding protein
MLKKITVGLAVLLAFCSTTAAQAETDNACNKVRFAQVNWTGVTIKTQTAAWILQKIGYETKIDSLSVPIVLRALAIGDADVFLGLWIPSQRQMAVKYLKKGEINVVTRNLNGGKYTVAVNKAAWDAGVHSFADLAKHADKFDDKIYGIEAGNEGNGFIKDMIKDDAYGMHMFELIPSSEAVMLTAVKRRIRKGQWAAWLAWAPHPMTINIDMKFLQGGEDYFGPDQGAAAVYSLSRTGYAWQCPNVGQFIENYKFTVNEQSTIADYVVTDQMDPLDAGLRLIKENPELIDRWLDQGGTYQTGPVQTVDGKDAGQAIKQALQSRD